jgi:hypothetical protein
MFLSAFLLLCIVIFGIRKQTQLSWFLAVLACVVSFAVYGRMELSWEWSNMNEIHFVVLILSTLLPMLVAYTTHEIANQELDTIVEEPQDPLEKILKEIKQIQHFQTTQHSTSRKRSVDYDIHVESEPAPKEQVMFRESAYAIRPERMKNQKAKAQVKKNVQQTEEKSPINIEKKLDNLKHQESSITINPMPEPLEKQNTQPIEKQEVVKENQLEEKIVITPKVEAMVTKPEVEKIEIKPTEFVNDVTDEPIVWQITPKSKPKKVVRKCLTCSKSIADKPKNTKYCSRLCSAKAKRKAKMHREQSIETAIKVENIVTKETENIENDIDQNVPQDLKPKFIVLRDEYDTAGFIEWKNPN